MFSKFCCVFCEMSSDDFEEDLRTMRCGGNPRILGNIRKLSMQYQEAARTHTKKQKLSSQNWKSCELLPVCHWEGDFVKILEICAPRYVIHYLRNK